MRRVLRVRDRGCDPFVAGGRRCRHLGRPALLVGHRQGRGGFRIRLCRRNELVLERELPLALEAGKRQARSPLRHVRHVDRPEVFQCRRFTHGYPRERHYKRLRPAAPYHERTGNKSTCQESRLEKVFGVRVYVFHGHLAERVRAQLRTRWRDQLQVERPVTRNDGVAKDGHLERLLADFAGVPGEGYGEEAADFLGEARRRDGAGDKIDLHRAFVRRVATPDFHYGSTAFRRGHRRLGELHVYVGHREDGVPRAVDLFGVLLGDIAAFDQVGRRGLPARDDVPVVGTGTAIGRQRAVGDLCGLFHSDARERLVFKPVVGPVPSLAEQIEEMVLHAAVRMDAAKVVVVIRLADGAMPVRTLVARRLLVEVRIGVGAGNLS